MSNCDSSRRTALKSGAATSRGRDRTMRLSGLDATGARRHDDHAVGEQDRLLDGMGHEHHRQPGALPQLQQLLLQALARHGVQRAERLVHQDHLGVVGQHARDRHALLHPARQLMRIGIGELRQADHLHEAVRGGKHLSAGQPARLGPERDIAPHRQPGEERVVLEHHAAIGAGAGDVGVPHAHVALRRHLEPADQAQQGGLATSRGADQTDELTFADGQRRVAQRLDLAGVGAERLRYALYGDDGGAVTHARGSSAADAGRATARAGPTGTRRCRSRPCRR